MRESWSRLSRSTLPSTRSPVLVVGWFVAAALTATVAALPVLLMVRTIVTTGANTVSNDDILYIGLVSRVLSGHYQWQYFLADTFVAHAHSIPIPMLTRLVIIRLTAWNVYAELWFGLGLTVTKVALLYDALTRGRRSLAGLLLLPALTALTFSVSQTDTFTYGDTAMELALNQFGLVLGIWSLARVSNRAWGAVWVGVGGVIAALSGGGGLPVLPVCLIGMVLFGYREYRPYLIWCTSAAVAFFPYAWFWVIHPGPWTGVAAILPYQHNRPTSVFNPIFVVGAVGYPFRHGDQSGLAAVGGILGLGLVLAGAILTVNRRNLPVFHESVPAFLLMGYAAGNIGLTAMFRPYYQSWYATHFMPLWEGLLALAYVFVTHCARSRKVGVWVACCLGTVGGLYVMAGVTGFPSNLEFLTVRTPTTAACLRNYRIAPDYCEGYVYNWGVGYSGTVDRLAKPLERYHLSVFAPQQQWTLQGDFILNTVRVLHAGTPSLKWTDADSWKSRAWSDFRHLNLELRAPNALYWTFHIPLNDTRATFETALRRPPGTLGRIRASITLRVAAGKKHAIFDAILTSNAQAWEAVHASLARYRGQTVLLQMKAATVGQGRPAWVAYEYPHVDISMDPSKRTGPLDRMPPIPAPMARDVTLNVHASRLWRVDRATELLTPGGDLAFHGTGPLPTLTYVHPLNLCLSDFTYVYLRASADRAVWPRAFVVYYRLNGETSFRSDRQFALPLRADQKAHSYTYDIKLLELPGNARLTGLRLGAVLTHPFPPGAQMNVEALGFLHGSHGTTCST